MKLDIENTYNAKYLAMLESWKCHKVVSAGKISLMAKDEPNGMLMIHAAPSNMPFAVPLDFLYRHSPEIGGYFVVYEDGYLSYSPASAFEAGYRQLEPVGCSSGSVGSEAAAAPATNMMGATGGPLAEIDLSAADFSDALMWLKEGKRVQRAGWNGAGQYVSLLVPQAPHPEDSPDAFPLNPYFKMWDNNALADGTFTPFLILKNAQNKVFPWFPSMGDLMATDWQVVS